MAESKQRPRPTSPLDIARDVIGLEIAGLEALRESLGAPFEETLELLKSARGRIIVTGMGKSGHVANKIASTFSSTGAPALYVHPGEASHGDLGMIAPGDVVLALSKSGETAELGDLLGYAHRFSIPIAAVTCRADSTLARAATAAVILPAADEACGETQAPTTSTTMMMALGDALAIALLRDKGITASEFHGFHPGGNLGAALRRVGDMMHGPEATPLCRDSASVAEAVAVLNAGGFGCVGLVDKDGRLAGILTDGDLRRQFGKARAETPVREVMTKSPKTIAPTTLAGDALALLSRGKITALFVVEDGKPIGLL
ncbi:MAG TPA: KpsF/GutQ family sugar-phosphate isomerase, partial [Parvularculaceae bacterium]|nr:KpsF/GutQ family sugar-phosphate isomerase [Parvularculaceae bacterium]